MRNKSYCQIVKYSIEVRCESRKNNFATGCDAGYLIRLATHHVGIRLLPSAHGIFHIKDYNQVTVCTSWSVEVDMRTLTARNEGDRLGLLCITTAWI